MYGVRKAFLVFMAIAVTAGALWFTNLSVTPKEATWEDVQSEAKQGGYHIINTEELWKRYTPRMGISRRSDQRFGKFPHGTYLVVTVAQGRRSESISWIR